MRLPRIATALLLAPLVLAAGAVCAQGGSHTAPAGEVATEDEEDAPSTSPRVLQDRISPRLEPAKVMELTRNAIKARRWEVASESHGLVARHRTRDKEAVMRISYADGVLSYIDETTFKDGAQRAVVPARWLTEIRTEVSGTLARAAVQAAAKEAGASSGDRTLQVRVPAALDPKAPIAEAVENQCKVEQMIANSAYRGMRKRYAGPLRISKQDERPEREIRLTILEVSGVGPGGWTRKTVRLRADLLQRDELVGSGIFDRAIGGRGGVSLRSACTILSKAAVSVGGQIGAWANAVLGEKIGAATDMDDEPDEADEAPKS